MFTILSRATFFGVLTSSLMLSAAYSEEKSFPKGEQTYKDICGRCHEVGIGPDFKGRKLPATFIVTMARSGFQAMPAFPMSHVDDATLLETAQYIENLPANPVTTIQKKD